MVDCSNNSNFTFSPHLLNKKREEKKLLQKHFINWISSSWNFQENFFTRREFLKAIYQSSIFMNEWMDGWQTQNSFRILSHYLRLDELPHPVCTFWLFLLLISFFIMKTQDILFHFYLGYQKQHCFGPLSFEKTSIVNKWGVLVVARVYLN